MDHVGLATLALTSRIVRADVKPLSAGEFWDFSSKTSPDSIFHLSPESLVTQCGVAPKIAQRATALASRSRSLALAIEELDHQGIWTLTAHDAKYPVALTTQLKTYAPAVLHGVGPTEFAASDGLGVVGSRDIDDAGRHVARDLARSAADLGVPVISGGARGVDQDAMNAAVDYGARVIGVLADSLHTTIRKPSLRQAVASGQVTLMTPYAPAAPFSAGNAMGRNKLIYALARHTVVVRSDEGSGGTWSGATEALKKEFGSVVSWTGDGAANGNHALVNRGATALQNIDDLGTIYRTDKPIPTVEAAADQLHLPM